MGILTEPWQEPVLGGTFDPAILNLPGIDQIRAWDEGLVPVPPMSHLTGIRMTAVGEGTSSFVMPVLRWFLAPQGTISTGFLAVLADPPLGCSVQTTLAPATPFTTAELSLTAVRPVTGMGRLLSAHGRVVHPGRRMALSEVTIGDDTGRLMAHGTSRCMILPPYDGLPPIETVAPVGGWDDAADPWRRPAMGEVVPQAVWEAAPGLEVLRQLVAGELPRPPISYLTGLQITEVGPGTATFALPASGWLASPTGYIEGGLIAMLADGALQMAIQSTTPPGCAVAALDLKINFLRPCWPDGRHLVGRGTVVHQGRMLVIANAEVVNAEGKRVALATGSSLLLPGRPASLEGAVEDFSEDDANAEAAD